MAGIGDVFSSFCTNLKIGNTSTISYRYKRITNQLNWTFYGYEDDTRHSIYTGSYGRDTSIDGYSDLDILFWLNPDDYSRYYNYSGNGASALLQAVRKSILNTYPNTNVGGDGQVVVVKFEDGMVFEVAPGFDLTDNTFRCPNSNGGGRWYITDPRAEQKAINAQNSACNQNLRQLARMMKAWKAQWSVPMGGLLIDTLAHNFISTWGYRDKSFLYYDFMSRDFFEYMKDQNPSQTFWYAPGSNQKVWRKGNFEYKAKRCYNISLEAINADTSGYHYTRNSKWRKIYGTQFPNN